MNIFAVHINPVIAAKSLCDKHIVKMTLETAQILSSAIKSPDMYKVTHENHPSCKWARENKSNYGWLVAHGLALAEEYTFRYGKTHKSQNIIQIASFKGDILPDGDLTDVPCVMGEQFKHKNHVLAYRRYILYKMSIMQFCFTKRKPPEWLIKYFTQEGDKWKPDMSLM